MSDPKKFRFSIDRGGTFTDIYAEVPGEPGYRVLKLLSEDPSKYDDAPREGIRRILQEELGISIPPGKFDSRQVEWVRMGTTLATNALLERKGARCALLITRGFGDLLTIGKQNRPRLFDLEIKKPRPLYETVLEVDERIRLVSNPGSADPANLRKGVTGEWVEVLQEPDPDRLRLDLGGLLDRGIRNLAVVTLHSWTWPGHERRIGALARELGFDHVTLSSDVMPRIRIVDRGQTCCVDAYLTPLLHDYLESFQSGFLTGDTELLFMQSDGGLVPAGRFSGSRAILSGPAGGVVGYAMTTYDSKTRRQVIGFDMGGTSTDVSRFDGEYEWVHETDTAGVHLQVPQLNIKTVAAGGGSRLFFRNGMFQAGPESAGAFPGPVCYRHGGPLALTDANLVLGRLLPDHFPKIFGPTGDRPLDEPAARSAFERLTGEVNAWCRAAGTRPRTVEEVACGFIEVANEVMARAVREISVARGYDIKDHVLACFGGAGGQHACALARVLGMERIFIHRFAGILSAYGLGLAEGVEEAQEPADAVLNSGAVAGLMRRLDDLARRLTRRLTDRGFAPDRLRVQRYLNLRFQGTDTARMMPQPPDDDFETAFRNACEREFGFDMPGREIVVDDIRVRVTGPSHPLKQVRIPEKTAATPPVTRNRCYIGGGWQAVPVHRLESLGAGERIPGPAILLHDTTTIVVEPGCAAGITPFGDVEIEVPQRPEPEIETDLDPIRLSVFSNKFMSIAEQMGRVLERTAISTNIKERHDFSCAVFGPHGDLVANAPHQPVHLGSMGEAVRHQMQLHGADWKEGEVLVSNHPLAGGSHLPDITVITPVIRGGEFVFFVAARGHHADVGGISPGSMPPFSRTLEEEGVCIKSFKLVENGVFQERGITELLLAPGKARLVGSPISGTRTLADNISDLKAQIAANRKGVDLLNELVEHYSLPVVQAYMGYIQKSAEDAVRDMLRELSRRRRLREVDTIEAEDAMDDGSEIRLRLTIDRRTGSAVFDFSGTSPQVAGNCNAPPTVTHSAIIYCLRCLVQSDIPLNQGCLKPVRIEIPPGSLLSPPEEAAVAAGNVLTSQRVTDVILKAFGAAAASQGCMNNLTFGGERFGYYETIGGGAGAGPGWNGQSGVHTHMTNTRITDPEILEKRHPVLLREFSIRRDSGGRGKFNGGDGLIREIEFLQPLHTAILSERRVLAPYGLEGGRPGAKGKNLFIKKDGTVIDLGGKNEVDARPGDRIRILTPGGGGYGKP